jgi:predicted glycogen debranching enzyme
VDPRAEYLEADGLGGFASGTVSGIRTRRYHALLLAATTPPTGRMVLVNGFDAWLETPAGAVALTSQAYLPDVTHPDGAARIASFQREPWPRWTFRLPDGSALEHELVVRRGSALVALFWRLPRARPPAILCVRPFFSGRDYHALHHENGGFGFAPERAGDALVWRPYPGVPAVFSRANARFAPEPLWFRSFRYDEERARGLDFAEDLAAPGVLRFDLAAGEAVWLLAAAGSERELHAGESAVAAGAALRDAERARRAAFATPLERAADAYVVRRGGGSTLVAGYPWFTDWGRDTFIALRGLCLATGRVALARDMLLEWSGALSGGMLPNRFADRGEAPEYNAVDASLWYVVAVHELLAQASLEEVPEDARGRLHAAVAAILEGYLRGTRHGIRVDADGLVAAGEPGVQLTWMDARVGERVITPRSGKPVEIQCLWLNALAGAAPRSARFAAILERGAKSFRERFWHEPRGFLYDVVDVEHRPGVVDATFRPNQIFAVGGLPVALLEGEPARRLVDAVERELWTPLGLRSLAPGEPGYAPRYGGGVAERDGAYHQGTVWPWLLGPFVEAWIRVRGGTARSKQQARERFLAPLLAHTDAAGLGHVSEIADAETPHTPAGCPFQAWSLGELLRLDRVVLAPRARPPRGGAPASAKRAQRASERRP